MPFEVNYGHGDDLIVEGVNFRSNDVDSFLEFMRAGS